MAGIRISPKHGVNPSIGVCWICGKDNGEVILAGRLKDDQQAPHRAVWNTGPCNECRTILETGAIFLIETRDGEKGNDPYRTGRLWGIKREAFMDIFHSVVQDETLKGGVCFIEESTAKAIGLHEHIPVNLEETPDGEQPKK